MPPLDDVHVLNPKGVIKGRLWRWREYPELACGPNVITGSSPNGGRKVRAEI